MIKNLTLNIFILLIVCSCSYQPDNYYIKTSVTPSGSAYNEKLKVAVISENLDNWWTTSVAHRVLITELMDAGFTVVERSNLDNILKEQRLSSASGLIKNDDEEKNSSGKESYVLDKNSISEIGEMLGVKKLILVYVVPNWNNKISLCTVRLVDVLSGKIQTSTTIHAPLSGKDIDLIMKQVANDMMSAYKTGKNIVRNKLSNSAPPTSSPGMSQGLGSSENSFRKKIDSN